MNDAQNGLRRRRRLRVRLVSCCSLLLVFMVDCGGSRVALGDVSWKVVEGQLPMGLELDSVTGALRGKATVAAEKHAPDHA